MPVSRDKKDDYQMGSDVEWLKHSNEELSKLLKKRQRQRSLWRFLCLLSFIALGWVVFKYSQKHPVKELWPFQTKGAVVSGAHAVDAHG